MADLRRSLRSLLLLGACLLALGGCANNPEITGGAAHPDLAGLDLEGVLVVGVTRHQKARVKFEDDLTRAFSRLGVRAVASHTLMPQERAAAEEIIADAARADLDTILVTRYLEAPQEEIDRGGHIYYGVAPAYGTPYYTRFETYYTHAWEIAGQQPVWTSDVNQVLVSDLYVADTGEHLWQAVTATLQAGSSEQVRDDALRGLVRELGKQGLLR